MEVVKCSRLHHPDTAGATYCTLDLCNGQQRGLGAKGGMVEGSSECIFLHSLVTMPTIGWCMAEPVGSP